MMVPFKAAPQSSVTAPQGMPPRSSASSSGQPHVHICVRKASKLRGCRRMLQAAPNPGSSCYVHHLVISTTLPSVCFVVTRKSQLTVSLKCALHCGAVLTAFRP